MTRDHEGPPTLAIWVGPGGLHRTEVNNPDGVHGEEMLHAIGSLVAQLRFSVAMGGLPEALGSEQGDLMWSIIKMGHDRTLDGYISGDEILENVRPAGPRC